MTLHVLWEFCPEYPTDMVSQHTMTITHTNEMPVSLTSEVLMDKHPILILLIHLAFGLASHGVAGHQHVSWWNHIHHQGALVRAVQFRLPGEQVHVLVLFQVTGDDLPVGDLLMSSKSGVTFPHTVITGYTSPLLAKGGDDVVVRLEPLVDVLLGVLPFPPRDVSLPLCLHLLSGEGDCLFDRHGRGLSWMFVVYPL